MKNFFILIFSVFIYYSNVSMAENIIIKSDIISAGEKYFNVAKFRIGREKKEFGSKSFLVVDNKGNEIKTRGIVITLENGEEFTVKIVDNMFYMYPFYTRNIQEE